MKKLLAILFVVGAFAACESQPTQDPDAAYHTYGAEITPDGAIDVNELVAQMEGQTEVKAKIKTSILGSCAKKGCWMTVDVGNEEDMMIRMLDYGFFVPTEGLEGLECIVEGKAFMDTVSVEMLQHYAEDAGKSEEEIAAITEPEFEMAFMADGILIENKAAAKSE
jgi:hypothetical protein